MIALQKELFEENIHEIGQGFFYGKYSVLKEGIVKAEFFDLQLAWRYIYASCKTIGYGIDHSRYLADQALKKYRQWEDTQCGTLT